MIAACGVALDDAILIVGAMAVGPEFGPLAGICTSVVQRHARLALRSLIALLVGFAVAMLATVGLRPWPSPTPNTATPGAQRNNSS